ncbi:hypothetical protein GOP47_0005585 [Adiantum capillus-veneris]|uniref:Beta-amylase n=1 Tax=Adiantum capillus-veneris TaxID=13818 RepID=A0A9D4V6B2_ADICA|nr:hypothetical protein GOP47_0005585 [Adiantum capillus-veneris]
MAPARVNLPLLPPTSSTTCSIMSSKDTSPHFTLFDSSMTASNALNSIYSASRTKRKCNLLQQFSRTLITASASAPQGDALGNNDVQFSSEAALREMMLQSNHIPFFVMLPMDTVTMLNTLRRMKALKAGLRALKLIGVDGVMMHVWWGVVEGEGPKSYDWSAYLALVNLIKSAGLKVQASMCFHGFSKASENCNISLPPWIMSIGKINPDIFFTDRSGNRFLECLSLSVDSLPLIGGRSPVQVYQDFLESFRESFGPYFGETIVEVIMGLGPEGELRYPAYREGNGLWKFPGVGEFQCYDKYMLESLKSYAEVHGKPEWGQVFPEDAPSYNQLPNDCGFFQDPHGSWRTPSGELFLSWYSGELLAHGNKMLNVVSSVFRKDRVVVVGKVPGVHWWYKSKSHAAEVTAGYYNIEGQDGYDKIARMFRDNSAMMILPCMEMSDKEQSSEASCSPEMLLLQIRKACSRHGVPVSGQNSLPRFDDVAYSRIKNSIHRFDYPFIPRLAVFTFLRMGESLFYAEHWRLFVNFVRNMDKDAVWGDRRDGPPFEGGQNRTFLGISYLEEQGIRLQPIY